MCWIEKEKFQIAHNYSNCYLATSKFRFLFWKSTREDKQKYLNQKGKENRLHRSGTKFSILKTIIGTLIFIVFTTSEQRRSCIRWETVTICQTIRHTRTINNYKIIPWSTWENSWKNRKLYTSNNSKPIVTSSHQSTVLF